MTQITIEHQPSQARIKKLRVKKWQTWEKEVSKFPIYFNESETAYILEGEVLVTPQGGRSVQILPGDLVFFPRGLKCDWQVTKPLRKHYKRHRPLHLRIKNLLGRILNNLPEVLELY